MKRIRVLAAFLMTALLLLSVTFCASAAVDTHAKVYDDAGLFTGTEQEDLMVRAQAMADRFQVDVVIVTTEDTNGSSTMEYADDFYDYNGFGLDAEHSGLLLLIDMQHREYWISTTGKAIKTFTDARLNTIIADMESDMRMGNYAAAAHIFLQRVQSRLFPYPRYIGISIPIGLGVGLLILLFMILAHNRKMKALDAGAYAKQPFQLTHQLDTFHSTHTTRTRRSEDSSSGGGGSSTHSSSSGTSHGGAGGSF